MNINPLAQTGLASALVLAVGVAAFGALLVVGFQVDTRMASYLVCFALLPVPFIAMTASVAALVQGERRVWAVLALVFAGTYALPCMICYLTQLAIVRNNSLGFSPEILKTFSFVPGSFAFAIDMLGYGFMALSSLFLGLALAAVPNARALRVASLVQGVFVLPSWFYPMLAAPPPAEMNRPTLDAGALGLVGWCVTFILAPVLAFRLFRRLRTTGALDPSMSGP